MPESLDLIYPGGSQLRLEAQVNDAYIGTASAYPLDIRTDNIPRLRLDQTGNVGIGTGTSPLSHALEVRGTIAATSLSVANALSVSDSVSINAPSSTATLEVNGLVRASAFEGNGSNLTEIQNIQPGSVAIAQLRSVYVEVPDQVVPEASKNSPGQVVVDMESNSGHVFYLISLRCIESDREQRIQQIEATTANLSQVIAAQLRQFAIANPESLIESGIKAVQQQTQRFIHTQPPRLQPHFIGLQSNILGLMASFEVQQRTLESLRQSGTMTISWMQRSATQIETSETLQQLVLENPNPFRVTVNCRIFRLLEN